MRETYRCLDGREALLQFDEDALSVSVTSIAGEYLGFFKFQLVRESGEPLSLIEDHPASVRQATAVLSEVWKDQGIGLRALKLVSDETQLPAAAGADAGVVRPNLMGAPGAWQLLAAFAVLMALLGAVDTAIWW